MPFWGRNTWIGHRHRYLSDSRLYKYIVEMYVQCTLHCLQKTARLSTFNFPFLFKTIKCLKIFYPVFIWRHQYPLVSPIPSHHVRNYSPNAALLLESHLPGAPLMHPPDQGRRQGGGAGPPAVHPQPLSCLPPRPSWPLLPFRVTSLLRKDCPGPFFLPRSKSAYGR